MIQPTNPYHIKPPSPKLLPSNYTQGIDNLTSDDFLKIYMETLRYQDPFQQQDLSKMLQDMVQLNQIKYFNDVKAFLEGLKGWFNQFTLLAGLSLVGKELIFSTDHIDTIKGGGYYLLSSEEIKGATLRVMDGDTVVKEFQMDINKGLNPIELSDLPKGQFTIKVFKEDLEVQNVSLGYAGTIKAVSVVNGELRLELERGELVSPSSIIYAGGV